MAKKNEPQPGDKKHNLSRRTFLKASAVGAGALALPTLSACKPSRSAEESPTPTPSGSQTPSPNGGNKPPDVQSITPGKAPETWIEPWVWRPSDWPGQQLHLNVVENENPGPVVGFGNANAVLFSYGGITPGPTIRMRGDETLFVKLRNLLGQDFGSTAVGPNPDLNELTPCLDSGDVPADVRQDFCLGEHTNGLHAAHVTNLHTHGLHVRPGKNPDGTHSDNVLLRVMSQADYRRRQQQATEPTCEFLHNPAQFDVSRTDFLRVDEQVGEVDSEFRLGDVMGVPNQPHPPGTHWYHPHSHGATHNQVASGMAGFLIVEGDVDEAINSRMTRTDEQPEGDPNPNPELKTKPYGYRERLMFIQRVLGGPTTPRDPDAPTSELKRPIAPAVNGNNQPKTITMRPGAIERWRVLNGSVDGRGFKRFMVLEGQYVYEPINQQYKGDCQQYRGKFPLKRLQQVQSDGSLKVVTRQEVEEAKQQLYQLAMDGVTLVTVENGRAKYTIKDLAQQNAGTQNPLADPTPLDPNPNKNELLRFQNVFQDGTSIKNCFVRPNEVYLGPANRADVFFQAPRDGQGKVYTVLAQAVVVHADNYQQGLQKAVNDADQCNVDFLLPGPEEIIVAYIAVSGDRVDNFDVLSLRDALPNVPPYLQPIGDDELRIPEGEAAARSDVAPDLYRTRTITYSGWGSQDFPLVSTDSRDPSAQNFQAFIDNDKTNHGGKLENLIYGQNAGVFLFKVGLSELGQGVPSELDQGVLPEKLRQEFDGQGFPLSANVDLATEVAGSCWRIDDQEKTYIVVKEGEALNVYDGFVYVLLPSAIRTMAVNGRKFDPSDHLRPRMLVDTAEAWVLYNNSTMLWGNTDTQAHPQTGQYKGHYISYPLSRAEGQARFANNDTQFQITTKGVDHPFHIHQNPFWVTRIEIPDENGELHNILDEPRWQDVVWIPRHRGRVVFRSRFPDYVGVYVHHCHILLHEDNGMMQTVEATPFADQTNYEAKPKTQLALSGTSARDVSSYYPRLTLDEAYRQSASFVDPNQTTGQEYPGFHVVPPRLP
jgi:FtsP/CotA-like multicopper oxidase with cupredoxin domain